MVCVTNTSASLWCCTEDGSRSSGAGFKPPHAAASKRRGSERLRKSHRKVAGMDGGDERKRTTEDASLLPQGAAKTGDDHWPWDESGRYLFTVPAVAGVKAA